MDVSLNLTREKAMEFTKIQPMETIVKHSVGIDISHKEFVASIAAIDTDQNTKILSTKKFSNLKPGFKALLVWVRKFTNNAANIAFAMEATGVYFEDLAFYLNGCGENVSVLLPNKVSHYAKTLHMKSKNDAIDSQVIARLAVERKLDLWQVCSPILRQLKQLIRERAELIKEKTQIKNQLHSKQAAHQYCKSSIARNKKRVRFIERQIEDVMDEIDELLYADHELLTRVRKIETIKGIGQLTALTIIAETNGFALIKSRKQLVSFCGYDVVERQSGTSLNGRSKISKKGNKFIRKALHYPSLSATQCDDFFKDFYTRINARNTSKMIGLVAVQRKLLLLVYALWKSGKTYNPKYNISEDLETKASFGLSLKEKKIEQNHLEPALH
jgi:transposase